MEQNKTRSLLPAAYPVSECGCRLTLLRWAYGMDAPGRLFQDQHFEVTTLSGCLVERIGYLRIGQAPQPDGHILYVKPVGGSWNRAFLDAGFAVWEDWGDAGHVPGDVEEEADVHFVDCTEKFATRVIRNVAAQTENERTSRIVIEFQDGARIELRHVDELDWESANVIVVEDRA